jgi:hypothetical protein
MWRNAYEGDRAMTGGEWELFRAGLAALASVIEWDGDSIETGIPTFDRLPSGQRLALLALVGKALRDVETPAPDLTAHTEGTVAAVFQFIRFHLESEVEAAGERRGRAVGGRAKNSRAKGSMSKRGSGRDRETHWRRLVLTAFRAAGEEYEGRLPAVTSRDADAWDLLVECLEERILPDADYLSDDDMLDADPDIRDALMAGLGIGSDYFVAVPDDPTDEQLAGIRREIRALVGGPGSDGRGALD